MSYHDDIAGQRNRIFELEQQLATANNGDGILCHDCMDTGWLENRVEGRYVCPCIRETEPYHELEQQLAVKDAEIARLNSGWQEANSQLLSSRIDGIGTRDELQRQLVEAKRQIMVLREAMNNAMWMMNIEYAAYCVLSKALDDTDDISGCIICDAEPVLLFRGKGVSKDFCTCDEERFNELSKMPHLFETTKLYKAKKS